MGPEPEARALAFYVRRGLQGLQSLRPQWEALESREGSLCYFQTYAWTDLVVRDLLADESEFIAVAAVSNGHLVAVLPLQIAIENMHGLRFRCLRNLGNAHVPIRDCLLQTARAGDVLSSAILKFLQSIRDPEWDLIRIERAPFGGALDQLFPASPLSMHERRTREFAYGIYCGDAECASLRNLSGKFRRNLARIERRADKRGGISYELVKDAHDLPKALETFFDIEHDSWKGKQSSSILSKASLVHFYKSVARQFAASGQCRVHLLYVGGQAVAAHFGLVSDGTFNLLKTGFRQGYKEVAPGNLLMAWTIRELSRDSEIQMIHLQASPVWARQWADVSFPLSSHILFRQTLLGRAGWAALRAWRFCSPVSSSALPNS